MRELAALRGVEGGDRLGQHERRCRAHGLVERGVFSRRDLLEPVAATAQSVPALELAVEEVLR
jgi:hypothetical protein